MSASASSRIAATVCAVLAFSAARAVAQFTLASDTFEITDHPTGDRKVVSASSGIPFFTRNATGASYSATIANDAVFGSAVLQQIDTTTAVGSNQLIGVLPLSIVLADVDDFITLAFKFRFLNVSAAQANPAGFRFGIWGENGTPVTADNQPAASDNDQGYYVQTGVGTGTPGSGNLFYNESGVTAPIAGGLDRAAVAASGAGMAFNDDNVHTVAFTLRRSSPTEIALSVTFDGGTTFTGTSTTNIRTSFNEIAFTDGFVATPVHFAIDDVVVTSNVPEPASALLCGFGIASIAAVRRRARA